VVCDENWKPASFASRTTGGWGGEHGRRDKEIHLTMGDQVAIHAANRGAWEGGLLEFWPKRAEHRRAAYEAMGKARQCAADAWLCRSGRKACVQLEACVGDPGCLRAYMLVRAMARIPRHNPESMGRDGLEYDGCRDCRV
jgi:hypothetical protein